MYLAKYRGWCTKWIMEHIWFCPPVDHLLKWAPSSRLCLRKVCECGEWTQVLHNIFDVLYIVRHKGVVYSNVTRAHLECLAMYPPMHVTRWSREVHVHCVRIEYEPSSRTWKSYLKYSVYTSVFDLSYNLMYRVLTCTIHYATPITIELVKPDAGDCFWDLYILETTWSLARFGQL